MESIKLKWLDSKNIYGTMNTTTINLRNITDDDKIMLMYKNDIRPSDLKSYEIGPNDKKYIFANHRIAFAEANGFDWHKMFMADQKHKNGSYFEITKEYVEANPNGWTDIPEDILIITDKVPGVAIGHPVADCPVIMMVDTKNNVTAIAHCSAELIDKKMPMMIADALNKSHNTKDDDIAVVVGPCAGSNWTYDKWPNFAKDEEFWKDSIVEVDGMFKIDLRKAIEKQLIERNVGIDGFTLYSMSDTITNSCYYSNSAARNNPDKHGRQFNGAIYQNVKKR